MGLCGAEGIVCYCVTFSVFSVGSPRKRPVWDLSDKIRTPFAALFT